VVDNYGSEGWEFESLRVRQQHHLVTSRFAADLVVSRRLFANTRANGTPDFGLAGLGDRLGEGGNTGSPNAVLNTKSESGQSDSMTSRTSACRAR
jgi:hypothetical protein